MSDFCPKHGANLCMCYDCVSEPFQEEIEALEKQIEAMRKCYIKLTDNGCNVEDDHWIYCADSKLMREFDEAFDEKDE